MRKLILSMQVSLDGFIEGEDGDSSWIQKDDPELWDDLFDMLKSVDLFLLGRVMFPDYRDYWKWALNGDKASADERKYAALAEKTPHIVFSNTLKDPGWANTRIIGGPVAEEVKKLKQEPGKSIQIVGGARLAATLMNTGLVDEYRITLNPCLIGKGKSFFRLAHSKWKLKLQHSVMLKSGTVILKYKTI
jgi:dihydrofolate reductase